jgi:hypothetical protein
MPEAALALAIEDRGPQMLAIEDRTPTPPQAQGPGAQAPGDIPKDPTLAPVRGSACPDACPDAMEMEKLDPVRAFFAQIGQCCQQTLDPTVANKVLAKETSIKLLPKIYSLLERLDEEPAPKRSRTVPQWVEECGPHTILMERSSCDEVAEE